MSKLTKEDFSFFKKECRHWADVFGLKNWEINISKRKLDNTTYAEATFDHNNRCSDIWINSDWSGFPVDINREELRKTALHEVLEILLYPMRSLAENRFSVTEELIDTEVHNIIRSLENVILNG